MKVHGVDLNGPDGEALLAAARDRIRAAARARGEAAGFGGPRGDAKLVRELSVLKGGATERFLAEAGEKAFKGLSAQAREARLEEAMQEAARAGSARCLLALAAAGADAAQLGALGQNLLLQACDSGNAEAIRELGAWGLGAEGFDNWGGSAVKSAAMAGAGLVRKIHFRVTYFKAREPMGFEALDAALELGGEIDAIAANGLTALGELCQGGAVCEEAIEALLERGADPNLTDEGAYTPWGLVAGEQAPSGRVCALLLRYGATPTPLPEGEEMNPEARAALEAWELERGGAEASAAKPAFRL